MAKPRVLRVRAHIDFVIPVPDRWADEQPDAIKVRDGIRGSLEALLRDHGLNNDVVTASVARVDIIDEADEKLVATTSS